MYQVPSVRAPFSLIALGFIAASVAGCSGSTIHTHENIGGVDTLSLDAKQRLLLVGERPADNTGLSYDYDGEGPKRVTCTEPMPDALVAQTAVLAASGNLAQPAGNTVGANLATGLTESAGSIAFRNHTIQMLRDGYYRLCEAYLNGAINKSQYRHMVLNADTFMVVISALQTIGLNQMTPAITLTPGTIKVAANKEGNAGVEVTPAGKSEIQQSSAAAATVGKENAKIAHEIVKDYLRYRAELAKFHYIQEQQKLKMMPRNKGV